MKAEDSLFQMLLHRIHSVLHDKMFLKHLERSKLSVHFYTEVLHFASQLFTS